jgi:hypothetical protein
VASQQYNASCAELNVNSTYKCKSLKEERVVKVAREKMVEKLKAFDDKFGNLDCTFLRSPLEGYFLTQSIRKLEIELHIGVSTLAFR